MKDKVDETLIWVKEHVIVLLIVAILIVIALFFLIEPKEKVKFELYGSSEINIYLGEQYYEYGYYLSSNDYVVKVISDLDTNKIGTYMIKYRLLTKEGKFKLEHVRKVNVIEDTLKNVTLTLNGDRTEYVLVNNVYKDSGAKATYNGNDITSSIVVSNNVDYNTIGNYEVKYSIKIDNREKTISRMVKVFDIIFESEVDYQNKIIDVNVVSYDFDHVLLPDKSQKTEEYFTYNYNKSGSHVFTVYTKKGYSKNYEVKVLDKEKPSGTCKAKTNDNKTEVTITATDEGGINRYTYNNLTFQNNEFTINEKLSTFMIRIYDNSDNFIDVECKTRRLFENNTTPITVPTKNIPCDADLSKYEKELADLVQEYGPKSRDAVAASAEYLVKYFPYRVPYFWGGKYKKVGLNTKWGCWREGFPKTDGTYVCTEQRGTSCLNGLDCTGYTAWAYVNAGFDSSIVSYSGQSTGMWGNFNAKKHTYSFSNKEKVALIKPGDIVHRPGHVGIVLGIDDTTIKIANMTDGIKMVYMKRTGGSFEDFVLMDDFFEMYGNKY